MEYNRSCVTLRSMPFWCVGSPLSDPFGGPVLERIDSLEVARLLAWGASQGYLEATGFHDDDLVPWDPENPEDDLDPESETSRKLRDIKAVLDEAGIRSIDGHIVGDSRFFDSTAEIDSWQWNDIGTYYGTGTSGLSFNENMQNINVTPGSAPGKPLKISIGYPDLPWMRYTFSCTTGEAGTGNTLYLFTSPFSTEGEMRGSFAIDRKTKTEQVSNKFPAYTCAWHFSRYLSGCGISCSGGAADLGRVFGLAPGRAVVQDSLTIIGTTYSPELSSIASETNHESNNMFAETLFKTIGREYCGEGTYDAALEASEGLLKELGAGTEGLHQADGSGLSRQDSFSPEFMCGFLAAMMDSPSFSCFAESLPQPGKGTLIFLLGKYPP